MKGNDFLKLLTEMEDEEHRILGVKGMEYTQGDGDKDRLANFSRLAVELGIPSEMVLWIYMKKHLDSIICYIKNGKEFSEEKIEGRIHDARNYLALLNAMIREKKKEKEK